MSVTKFRSLLRLLFMRKCSSCETVGATFIPLVSLCCGMSNTYRVAIVHGEAAAILVALLTVRGP